MPKVARDMGVDLCISWLMGTWVLCTSLVPEDMGIMYITGSWGHGYYVHHWFLGTWVLCTSLVPGDMGVMYITGS